MGPSSAGVVAPVAIVMPSLASRHELRAEALACIDAQTVRPAVCEPWIDHERIGLVRAVNAAAELALEHGLPWLWRCDDDDLFDPDHLETLVRASDGADVIYSWPRLSLGSTRGHPTAGVPFNARQLRRGNIVSSNALIRAELWRELGGVREPGPLIVYEDWDLWLRALNAGARFVCIERETWTYRFDPAWDHASYHYPTPGR